MKGSANTIVSNAAKVSEMHSTYVAICRPTSKGCEHGILGKIELREWLAFLLNYHVLGISMNVAMNTCIFGYAVMTFPI